MVPQHIAIIMDGNGRWALERGLPRLKGHQQGARNVEVICKGCIESKITYLTLYAFSTENWKRPPHEVAGLMFLLECFLNEKVEMMQDHGIRLAAIGRTNDLPHSARKRLEKVIAETSGNTRLTLTLALNYGGRNEIVDALRVIARKVQSGFLEPDKIDASTISDHLYTHAMPDPDLLIRTSGEMRLSNFLLWQLNYTEIHVSKKLWPDFEASDLTAAIDDFQSRERRYGVVKNHFLP